MNNKVILVDQQDNAIGEAEKLMAHQQGLLHRAFSIFIFTKVAGKTYLLIQKRHEDKYHSGGLWTNTCCSHPQPGENTIPAGERRLQEEMGFTTVLQHAGEFQYQAVVGNDLIEHEYDHVLVGFVAEKLMINFDPREISAIEWCEINQLKENLVKYPEQFTAWFATALQIAVVLVNTGTHSS